MTRAFGTVLLLTLFLCACSPGGLSPQMPPTLAARAPTEDAAVTEAVPTTEILPDSSVATPPPKIPDATPHIDQPPDGASTASTYPQGCGYQWAYQDLPELSSDFLLALQNIQPEAQGYAFVFGEDCIHEDGSATFIPMETDFNITFQAANLSDEPALGNMVVKVMEIIEAVPPERIIGPRPGRVSILFESGEDRKGVNFYIDEYQALPADLRPVDIFQKLQTPQ